ncbi:TPA: hypothetical protein R1X71_001477 [Campylobacter upsaliensis]|nr:hypothetical protein [Campylobacter upsaliensis]
MTKGALGTYFKPLRKGGFRREFKKVLKGKFKVFANSARVKHFRNLKRLRRFFSKGLNYLITQNFKFLKSSFVILLESELKGRGRAFSVLLLLEKIAIFALKRR